MIVVHPLCEIGDSNMNIQTIADIFLYIAVTIFVLSSTGLIVLVCVYLAKRARKSGKIHRPKRAKVRPTYSYFPNPQQAKYDIFPNGYSRQDYYDNGMFDDAIAELGLDQPSAPAPGIAGIVLADLIMGKEWDDNK